MNIMALTALSFGMAMDAFAVALAKGAGEHEPKLTQALKGGLFFGVVEGFAPLIGFWLGSLAQDYIQKFDHWIAFILLGFLGVRFLMGAIGQDDTEIEPSPQERQGMMMILTAIATSVDSMVVGVSLAFLDVNIYVACLLIGMATTIMATGGLYLGGRLGVVFGRYAMGVGGVVLILIGAWIWYGHVSHHGFLA